MNEIVNPQYAEFLVKEKLKSTHEYSEPDPRATERLTQSMWLDFGLDQGDIRFPLVRKFGSLLEKLFI